MSYIFFFWTCILVRDGLHWEREFTERKEKDGILITKIIPQSSGTVAKTVAVINRVTWKTRQATNKNVFSKSRPHEWVLHHITTWKNRQHEKTRQNTGATLFWFRNSQNYESKLLKRILPIQMTVGTSKRWLIVPSKPRLKKFPKTLPCVVGVAIAQGHFGSSEGPPWEKREKPAEAAL